MKTWQLAWRFLRYRVAIMLLLFLLLGTALHTNLANHYGDLGLAVISLFLSYISATSLNDLADQKIDAINHPSSFGRPLITGAAKRQDVWRVFYLASAGSLLFAALISWRAVFLMGISLLINAVYSMQPLRLSYRTFMAPLVLGIAYVGIPYGLGLSIAGNFTNSPRNLGWFIGLYLIFIGRIILKDFRDRRGDKRYHKPTFLLRYGKARTCYFSLITIAAGGVIILWQLLDMSWPAAVTTSLFLAAIIHMLYRLFVSKTGSDEQIYIGIGAKLGNGLLLNILGVLTLKAANATWSIQFLFSAVITGLFYANYLIFLQEPQKISLGYKG